MRKSKHALLDWVDDVAVERNLCPRAKLILAKLAFYAQEDGTAWATVATLAKAGLCSERSAQYKLRDLQGLGLIEVTSRTHRLPKEPGKAQREVPIYQLAPGVEGFDARVPAASMGAKPAPMPGPWVQSETSMGATVCTPKNLEEPRGSLTLTARARDRLVEVMGRLRAAYPKRALGWSDPDAAMAALEALAAEGVDVDQLPGCAERMGADPAIRRRDYGPPRLEAWLAKRQFEGWWPEPAGKGPEAAPGPGFAGPAELRAAIVAAKGEAYAAAYLDRAGWEAEQSLVRPATGIAAQRLAEARDVFRRFGVELAAGAAASGVRA